MGTRSESEHDSMPSVGAFTHVRIEHEGVPDGIYRVVGVAADRVTLLRVGDLDGRRVNTGRVVDLDAALVDTFPDAPNPDGNRPVSERLARLLTTGYWSTRAFVRSLRSNPVYAGVAGAVLLIGLAGESVVSLPEIVFDLLVLLGAVGLAAVGSGRLSQP